MTHLDLAKLTPASSVYDAASIPTLGHDLRAALADIIGGLRLISPDGLDDAARIQFEQLRASAESIAGLTDAPCDGLDQLLAEADPTVAAELLDQLLADLRMVERDLTAGLAQRHVETTRTSTHILIELAGAAGVQPLLSLARKINAAAYRRDMAAIADLGKGTLDHLARLITTIAQKAHSARANG